jgi:hypothetical protein
MVVQSCDYGNDYSVNESLVVGQSDLDAPCNPDIYRTPGNDAYLFNVIHYNEIAHKGQMMSVLSAMMDDFSPLYFFEEVLALRHFRGNPQELFLSDEFTSIALEIIVKYGQEAIDLFVRILDSNGLKVSPALELRLHGCSPSFYPELGRYQSLYHAFLDRTSLAYLSSNSSLCPELHTFIPYVVGE